VTQHTFSFHVEHFLFGFKNFTSNLAIRGPHSKLTLENFAYLPLNY